MGHSHLTMQKIYTFHLSKYHFIYFTFLLNNIFYILAFIFLFIKLKQSIKPTPTTISNNNKSHQQEHSERVRERRNKKLYNLLKGVLFLRLTVASCIVCYSDAFLDTGAFLRVLYILECILHLDDFALNVTFFFLNHNFNI